MGLQKKMVSRKKEKKSRAKNIKDFGLLKKEDK